MKVSSEQRVRPVRLVDIAAAAGLHPSVVSRILNGDETLSTRDETRDRVRTLARELGYRPNASARSLKNSSTQAIGLIVPSLRNPLWSEVIRGALAAAAERGFVVLVAEVADESSEEAYERLLDAGRVDGFLVITSDHRWTKLERRSHVPLVHVGRAVPEATSNITMDEEAAAALVSSHLRGLGHARITHIDGPASIDTVARRSRALAGEWGTSLRVLNAPFDEEGGFAAMGAALDGLEDSGVTAITIAGFNQLLGALEAVRERGLRIPEDVSLVCYDDDRILDYLDIKVTGVRMPLYELGRDAMAELGAVISGGEAGDRQVSGPVELVRRRSTRAVG